MVDPEKDDTQMEPNDDGIDRLLRHSMGAPIPSLPADFDQRLMREVRRDSQPFDPYHGILFASYGVVSVVVSATLMRAQGLAWSVVSGTIVAALTLVAITRSGWRATRIKAAP